MEIEKRVFISYSWDSEEHKEWILNLANRLTDKGIYVILDRFDLQAGKSMTHFMENALVNSDKVLMIMTSNYKEKADKRTGGVGYEYSMVTQALYLKQDNTKFIPVLRQGSHANGAPIFLGTFISHDMTKDAAFEKDFSDLVRLIYDEPEIKRRPLGKKPVFSTASKASLSSSLIDDKINLSKSKMTTCAKWTFVLKLNSLENESKEDLFSLIKTNTLVDKENKIALPHILITSHKTSHHPNIVFEIPLHPYLASNLFMNEKLKIEEGLLHYEFAEYSDHASALLFITEPFATLLFLLVIIKAIHDHFSKNIDIAIEITFDSNQKAFLYKKHSPFEIDNFWGNYEIPDNHAQKTIKLSSIDKNSVYLMFEKIYHLFISDNPKAINPYVKINRSDFDKVTADFLK